jgi:hypothetical protein
MVSPRIVASLTAVLALIGSVANAQQGPASVPERAAGFVEVTPHVSFGSSRTSGIGAAIGLRIRPRLTVELDAEARLSNVEHLGRTNANLLIDLPIATRWQPYVVVGAGLETYRGFHYVESVGTFGYDGSGLVGSVGGGFRVPLGERWAWRSELRFSAGISEAVPDTLRVFQGVTFGVGPR